jgi:thioredoxin 1
MASDKIKTLNDMDFDTQVIKSTTPVLVDFWAEWCGPCRMIAPTVDALASEFEGKLIVGKLNVDDNPVSASRFGVRGIPTLLLFKGGQIVEQVVGVADKTHLKRLLDKHV